MLIFVFCFLVPAINSALSAQGGPRQNLLRLAREDNKPTGTDAVRHLLSARSLNHLGGGQLLRALDPLSGGRLTAQLSRELFLAFLDGLPGGDALRALDALADGELTASLENADAAAVLRAIRLKPKRTLDTLAGMAFGESKRFDSLSGATFGLSKRDFDEIDNVGFTGFAKRGGRSSSLALAKKNFDEIDRAGFDSYNKRNFDEIDRAGFETFEKRDGKK